MSSDFSLFNSISEIDSEDISFMSSNEVVKNDEMKHYNQIFGLRKRRVLIFICLIFIIFSVFVVCLILVFYFSASTRNERNSEVLVEKKDISFLDFGEEETECVVGCRCSAQCTIDLESDEYNDFDERRKINLFVQDLPIVHVLVGCTIGSIIYKIGEHFLDKRNERNEREAKEKAEVEFEKQCKGAIKNIQCECEDEDEYEEVQTEVPMLIWKCKAKCFDGREATINLDFSETTLGQTIKKSLAAEVMLLYCKEMDKNYVFNSEEHGSYIKDNYILCKKANEEKSNSDF